MTHTKLLMILLCILMKEATLEGNNTATFSVRPSQHGQTKVTAHAKSTLTNARPRTVTVSHSNDYEGAMNTVKTRFGAEQVKSPLSTTKSSSKQNGVAHSNGLNGAVNETKAKSNSKKAITSTAKTSTTHQSKAKLMNPSLSIDKILLVCGFAFTFIVGIFGNGFVCYVFGYKLRRRRSVTETLLLYLGIVDLFASLVNPLLFIYWTVTRYQRWDFGIAGCKLFAPLAPILITLSATIIIIICIDRYRAIVFPFKGRYRKVHINMFVAIAIVASIFSYLGYAINLEVDKGYPCVVKSTVTPGHAIPHIIITLVRDIGYIILFCFTSVAIYHHLGVDKQIQMNSECLKKRRKNSRRICRVLFRIGIVFAILVFPKDILSLVSTISWMSPPGIAHSSAVISLNAWLKVLNVSNSCVNVFIYSHMHARFKRELRRVLCCGRATGLDRGQSTMVTESDYERSSSRGGSGRDKSKMEMTPRNENNNPLLGVQQLVQTNNDKADSPKRNVTFAIIEKNGFSDSENLITSSNL